MEGDPDGAGEIGVTCRFVQNRNAKVPEYLC